MDSYQGRFLQPLGSLVKGGTGGSSSSLNLETTSLAYGSSSPLALFTTGAGDLIEEVEVVIDTAFNGTPTLSIGISGTPAKYAATTDFDLTMAAGTSFLIRPNLAAQGVEALIATYSAGGASAGAARIIIHYGTPT